MAANREQVFPAAPSTIGRGLVASSFQYYLKGDEQLWITSRTECNSVVVTIVGRMWRAANQTIQEFERSYTVTASGGFMTLAIQLEEGALLNLCVRQGSTPVQQLLTFTRVQLTRGGDAARLVLGTLLQGYISSVEDLGWPGSPLQHTAEGPGVTIDVDWLFSSATQVQRSVTTGSQWRVICGRVIATMSAVVANRQVAISALSDIGTNLFTAVTADITAGQSIVVSIGAGTGAQNARSSIFDALPWPVDLLLPQVYTVRAQIVGAQAGDALTGDGLLVTSWFKF